MPKLDDDQIGGLDDEDVFANAPVLSVKSQNMNHNNKVSLYPLIEISNLLQICNIAYHIGHG